MYRNDPEEVDENFPKLEKKITAENQRNLTPKQLAEQNNSAILNLGRTESKDYSQSMWKYFRFLVQN